MDAYGTGGRQRKKKKTANAGLEVSTPNKITFFSQRRPTSSVGAELGRSFALAGQLYKNVNEATGEHESCPRGSAAGKEL